MLNRLIGLNWQERNLIMHFFAEIPHPRHILHQGRWRNYLATVPLLSQDPVLNAVFKAHSFHKSRHIHICITGGQLLQQYVVINHIFILISRSLQSSVLFVTINAVQISGDWYSLSSWGCWVANALIQLTWDRGEYLTWGGQEPEKESYLPDTYHNNWSPCLWPWQAISFFVLYPGLTSCQASKFHNHHRQLK